MQDIDLELNVDNSAFYDQFAIAQVGGIPGGTRGVPCPPGSPSPLWGPHVLDAGTPNVSAVSEGPHPCPGG